MSKTNINRGCYVSIKSDLYENEPSDGLVLKDKNTTIQYELSPDTPCDRSDLAGLNIDYQNGNLNIIMEISEIIAYTHLVKDSDGFIFAVEIANL